MKGSTTHSVEVGLCPCLQHRVVRGRRPKRRGHWLPSGKTHFRDAGRARVTSWAGGPRRARRPTGRLLHLALHELLVLLLFILREEGHLHPSPLQVTSFILIYIIVPSLRPNIVFPFLFSDNVTLQFASVCTTYVVYIPGRCLEGTGSCCHWLLRRTARSAAASRWTPRPASKGRRGCLLLEAGQR